MGIGWLETLQLFLWLRKAIGPLNPRPELDVQKKKFLSSLLREMRLIDDQHEAVALLLSDLASSPLTQDETRAVPNQEEDAEASLLAQIQNLPSYPHRTAELVLEEADILRCFRAWLALADRYLHQFDVLSRFVQSKGGGHEALIGSVIGVEIPAALLWKMDIPDGLFPARQKTLLDGIQLLIDRGSFEDALSQIDDLLKDASRVRSESASNFTGRLHHLAAQALFRLGRLDQSRSELSQALELLPASSVIQLHEIQFLAASGQLNDADCRYQAIPPETRASQTGIFTAAFLALERGDYAAGASLLEDLSGISSDPEIHGNLAICLSWLGKHKDAIRSARVAVAQSKGAPDFYSTLGSVLLYSFLSGIEEATRSVKEDGVSRVEVGFYSGEALARAKRQHGTVARQAADAYRTARERGPYLATNPVFLGNSGLAYLFSDELEDAERTLDCLSALRSMGPPVLACIDAKIRLGKYDEALKLTESDSPRLTEDEQAFLRTKRAEILLHNRDYDGAESALTQLIDEGVSDEGLYWNRGLARKNSGNLDGADTDIREAKRLGFDPMRALRSIAEMYRDHGMESSAIGVFNEMVDEGCREWEVFDAAAELLLRQANRYRDARYAQDAVTLLERYPGDLRKTADRAWIYAGALCSAAEFRRAGEVFQEVKARFLSDFTPEGIRELDDYIRTCRQRLEGESESAG